VNNRFVARLVFFFIFFVIYSLVRGVMGDTGLSLFVAPAVAGIATVAISYWIRARQQRE
jgi:hypothetical protein